MAREVTIVDAGLGNLAGVERALVQVGAAVRVSSDPDKVATARMVVFPGQGAFGPLTQAVVDGAMGAALRMVIDRGDPFLGISMGLQLLFDASEENQGHPGLQILPGRCRRFPNGLDEEAEPGAAYPKEPIRPVEPRPEVQPPVLDDSLTQGGEHERGGFDGTGESSAPSSDDPEQLTASSAEDGVAAAVHEAPDVGFAAPSVLAQAAVATEPAAAYGEAVEVEQPKLRRLVKVPHMGWNCVEPTDDHYYFCHSYYVEPERAEDIMWMCTFGGIRFPAAVRYQNVLGTQFQPEKSQRAGLRFLRAFILGGWG